MSASKNSSVYFWLTLGFAAGLAFGWAAFRNEAPPATVGTTIAPAAPKSSPAVLDRTEVPINAGSLRAIEKTFERWGGYAVWENNVTEIAAWDARRKRHADFYEVRRHEGKFYFRSLSALKRPLIDHGVSATMPIAFTEPQWMRDQFYREHPDYDPATAPRVDLPPLPPQRFSTERPKETPTTTPTPRNSDRFTNTPLTPGAGY